MTDLFRSTAALVTGRGYLSADHISAATGLDPIITISKNGGNFANPAAGASVMTEIEATAWYKFALGTADTDTVGPLIIRGTHAGMDNIEAVFEVVEQLGNALAISYGTAGVSGVGWITLAATEPAAVDVLNGCLLSIVAGTGRGQSRLITDWLGAAGAFIATVDWPWAITPDDTSIYRIYPFSGILLADTGVCIAAGASTITLSATASGIADTYIGHTIYIGAGAGYGQARLITAYSAARVATVSPAWTTALSAYPAADTSIYKVLPVGRVYVDDISTAAQADIWTYATRTLTSTAAATTAAVTGSTLAITKGATYTATLSGMTIPATWAKVYLTLKQQAADTDAQSVLQIVETAGGAGTDGLLYLEGAAGTAGHGDLVVTQAAGTVAITIADNATILLAVRSAVAYDIKCLLADGTSQILTQGVAAIGWTPTLTI